MHKTAAIAGYLQPNSPMPIQLFDFTEDVAVQAWSPINDGVMGGISQSSLRQDLAGFAVFEGIVSLENNGGFASVRCLPLDLGVPGKGSYVLDVLGDGKRYKFNLRTDNSFDGVNYQVGFHPPAGVWTEIRLAVADFLPSYRGRQVPDAPPLDPAKVRQIGLMIADRQAGPFALKVRSIRAE